MGRQVTITMIYGIGNDIIEIKRIKKACEKEAFLRRVYTENEMLQSNMRASYLAGCFAVKEAVSKSFGTGVRNFRLNEIEVLRDKLGKPYVCLTGNAKKIADSLGIMSIHAAITNTKELAAATVVAESR
jgi:holo-[acyl-carrier protein] synthase